MMNAQAPARASTALASGVLILARRLRQERGTGLSATQLSSLGSLMLVDGLTMGRLATRECVSSPSMTAIVGSLVDRGLVTRSPAPDDGRQVMIRISERGREELAQERARRDQWLDARLALLGPEDRRCLEVASRIMIDLARA